MGLQRQDQPARCRPNAGKVLDLLRNDAPEAGKGKACGNSYIPKSHKCSVNRTKSALVTAGKIAAVAGLVAGGVYVTKKIRSKPLTMEEWRNSPNSARNKQKLTPEQAQKITDEAIAGGNKWDVQEDINARRFQAECGLGLGKVLAPAKFDAQIRTPRCQAGEGAFGTYFVHPKEKYGVKLYRGDEDDVQWEFDRLDRAHGAGVNVPEPLYMNSVKDADGDLRTQTLVLSHMKGYKTIEKLYPESYGTAMNAPDIVKVKIAREFRKLHIEGLAHGDIHGGNIMAHPRSKKTAIIDFGYSTAIDDRYNPHNSRSGVDNLLIDLRRLPKFLGFDDSAAQDFLERQKGVIENIQTQALNYSREYDKYELGIKRYHDILETELLYDTRKPRSRFISGADQPRIPGLTRRILTANANTMERGMLLHFGANTAAKDLGVKPLKLWLALKPERDAAKAARANLLKIQPFGTPLPDPGFSEWKD